MQETECEGVCRLPKGNKRKKEQQWPRMKKARELGKTAIFLKSEPNKLFINGHFMPR